MITWAQKYIAPTGAIFLIAGLWTPIVGVLVAINEVSIALSASGGWRQDTWLHVFLAVLALSVAMLGPGAWSLDARIFGRKRFDMNRAGSKRSSH